MNGPDPVTKAPPPANRPKEVIPPASTSTPRPPLDPALRQLTPGSLQGRLSPHREALLKEGGGTAETEAAVARGLEWIVKQQPPDGSWKLAGYDAGHGTMDEKNIGATALALLPLLAMGKNPARGPYQKEVENGLAYLMKAQLPDGRIGENMYSHALAALALAESHFINNDGPQVRTATQKALDFSVSAQGTAGGWRYVPRADSDTSATGWHYMALRTGQLAGRTVPASTFANVSKFLDSVEDPAGGYGYMGRNRAPACTAIGVLCRLYEGLKPDDPRIAKAVDYLLARPFPDGDPNFYEWYYTTQVMRHVGGEPWEKWRAKVVPWLLENQEKNDPAKRGSWSPARDPHRVPGGRLMTTSFAVMMLQAPYRHVPLWYREAPAGEPN